MTPEQAKTALDKIRALVTTSDDSPEGQMGDRWILGQVREILDGPGTEPRTPGCECQWEAGDSPCRIHGEDGSSQVVTVGQTLHRATVKGITSSSKGLLIEVNAVGLDRRGAMVVKPEQVTKCINVPAIGGAPDDEPQTTALEDLREVARGNPVLLAVVQAQTVGDLFRGASILLPVADEVLDAAAKLKGAYEYRSEATRTVTIEDPTFELTFHSIEQTSRPLILPTRKLYLEIGPRADVMHAIDVKNGITEVWRETRREVAAERDAGVRGDRIERIAEALYDAGWLRVAAPKRAADALTWLNGASITSAEVHAAAYLALHHTWPTERKVKMIPILRSGETATDGTLIRFELRNIN